MHELDLIINVEMPEILFFLTWKYYLKLNLKKLIIARFRFICFIGIA